jgi:hypothetical protein
VPWLVATIILVVVVVAVGVIGAALMAGLTSRPARRTAADVATYLRDFIEGTGGEMDWDHFESVPIADPELERIRREALAAGPPDADLAKLRDLLRQAEELAQR